MGAVGWFSDICDDLLGVRVLALAGSRYGSL